MSIFAQAGSGWTLEANNAIILEMVEYQPIGGSSYIELPKNIYDTKSIVNVQNEDKQCFMWSVLSALHPDRTLYEATLKKKRNKITWCKYR